MIVVDTSVLVNLFRGRKTSGVEQLRAVIQQDIPFAIPDVCAMEVLFQDPWGVHVEAARIFYDCRRTGLTVRSSADCLVAAMTLEVEGMLLHEDRDYEAMARVRPLRFLG